MILPQAATAHRIFSRNCTVRRIDKDTAAAFLSANHDYGDASCRYRYGLFVRRRTGSSESAIPEGQLVAVSEFSSGRKMHDGTRSYEWVRYASLRDLRVVGGMSKTLSAFVEDVHPDDVMTYVPSGVASGDSYREMGFEMEGVKEFPDGSSSVKFRKRF